MQSVADGGSPVNEHARPGGCGVDALLLVVPTRETDKASLKRDLVRHLDRERRRRQAARAVAMVTTPQGDVVVEGTVYLIHLDRPVCPWRPAQHYIGTAISVEARLAEHRAGTGARMLAAANERGIGYRVVRTWSGGRGMERRLKNRKEAPSLCPLCQGRRPAR